MDNAVVGTLRHEDYPSVYRTADSSSMNAQARFLKASGASLALIVLAASMGAVTATWGGWVGAGAFAVAILIGILAVTQNLERTWYDGRALAESAKSLTWLYIARGGDLADTAEPDRQFKARLAGLRDELERLDFTVPSSGPEVSERMRALRGEPLVARRELYTRERIGGQAGYYRRRGIEHEVNARRFRAATVVAEILGIVGAILRATSTINFDLLGVGAALAAAITAWLRTRDHATLARAYQLTARDLDAVREDIPTDCSESEWSAFAKDAEAAMSREHVMWLARRGRLAGRP
jgi:SMODS and SLOG-associating 2TM effector domain 1/SMODS and SLOG-associating 2TM effector domain 3